MVAEVVPQEDWFSWSLNQLSREFGIARETVGRRLSDANIKPAGERRGHPVYRVKDAATAILMPQQQSAVGNDPDNMSPKERADWYKSENDRLKFEKESGVLTYANDAREQMAEVAKMGLQVLDTFTDILERDFQIEPEIIAGVEIKIDELRNNWADALES